MRRYESVVILHPDMPDEDIRSFTERYSNVIKSNGGEIIKIEDWGFKRLAYLVRKKDRGRYILFDYVGLPALIAELERQLKITEEVMKFISVKLDEDVDLEAFKAAAEEKRAAAKPEPVPVVQVEPEAASAEETAHVEPEAAPAEETAHVEPEAAPAEETAQMEPAAEQEAPESEAIEATATEPEIEEPASAGPEAVEEGEKA